MNTKLLRDTARGMVAADKGLLAMDETNPTCRQRLIDQHENERY